EGRRLVIAVAVGATQRTPYPHHEDLLPARRPTVPRHPDLLADLHLPGSASAGRTLELEPARVRRMARLALAGRHRPHRLLHPLSHTVREPRLGIPGAVRHD